MEERTQGAERSRRLLVVDDEIHIARSLRDILSMEGYSVVTASNGEEAVHMAAEWRPDLVLSDVVMPRMSGVEACIRIRSFLPTCKFVLLTGHAVVHDLMRDARARGHEFDILFKPVHPLDLIEHLRAVLTRN